MAYISEIATDCYLGSFTNLLKHHGVMYDATHLQFLYGGDTCNYYRGPSPLLQNIILKHRLAVDIIDEFCKRNEIHYENTNLKSPEQADELIQKQTSKKEPFLILIDVQNVSYHPYYGSNKSDNQHIITIIDSKDDEVYIADCLVPTFPEYTCFEGWTSKKEIIWAWQQTNFCTFTFDIPKDLKNKPVEKISLRDSLKRYYDNEENNSGLYSFINDFKNYDDLFSANDQKKNMIRLCFNIQFLGTIGYRNSIKTLMIADNTDEEILKQYNKYFLFWKTLPFLLVKKSLTPETCKASSIAEKMLKNYLEEKEFLLKYYGHS